MKASMIIPSQTSNVSENITSAKNVKKGKKTFSFFVKKAKDSIALKEKDVKKKKSKNDKDEKQEVEFAEINFSKEKKLPLLIKDIKKKKSIKNEKINAKNEKNSKPDIRIYGKRLSSAKEKTASFIKEDGKSVLSDTTNEKNEDFNVKKEKNSKLDVHTDDKTLSKQKKEKIEIPFKDVRYDKKNETVTVKKDEFVGRKTLNNFTNKITDKKIKEGVKELNGSGHQKNTPKVTNEEMNFHFEKNEGTKSHNKNLKNIKKTVKIPNQMDNRQKNVVLNFSNGSNVETKEQNLKVDIAPKDFHQNENRENFQKKDFEDVIVKFSTQVDKNEKNDGIKEFLKENFQRIQIDSKKFSKDYEVLPQLNRGEVKEKVIKNDVQDTKTDTTARISKQVITAILRELKTQKPPLKIEIRLNPPDLGKITLEIREKMGKTSFILNVENEKTKELMKNVLPVMINQLSNLNFNVVEIQMNGQQWLNDGAGQQKQKQDQQERKKEEKGRNFTKEFKELRKEEV